ncbi:MAG: oligosaccharide flippase family protein [Clostridia bacterium]|nr:oligosaccharide flippase family protein [Clostridia bacterium]
MDRKGKIFRNTFVGTLCYFATLLIGFVTRTIFIYLLGKDYLGINGLFTNILSLLSFAEMGIGTAIIYALYKPLAEDNKREVAALMNFYKKAYSFIGIFITVAGLCLAPFLGVLIKDKPDIQYLELFYILILADTVVSYFFTYKRSIIIASQNSYLNSLNNTVFTLLQNVLQIVILIITHSYILFLTVRIFTTLMSNIAISKKADVLFPYLKEYKEEHIEKKTLKSIVKNVVAMMCSKFGAVMVAGTDNLLISAFVGVQQVALYSNYVMINTMIYGVINQVYSAVTASVGNLNATEDTKHSYNAFQKLFFVNFVIICTCTSCLFVVFNPFIKVWIGEEYLFSMPVVGIIVLNFYITGMRNTSITYINTYGLFWQIKYKSLIEAVINIVASMVLLIRFEMGIYGVLLGTTISTLFTNVWWEPYVVYKTKFKRSVMGYLLTLLGYTAVTCIVCAVSQYISLLLPEKGLLGVILRIAICLVADFGIITVIFGRTENYRYCIKTAKDYLVKFINKQN